MHLQHSIYNYILLSSSYRDDIYTSNPTFSPFYLHASDNFFFFLNLSRDPWPLVNSCNMDANRPPGLSCQADPVRTRLFLIQNLHITISFFLYGSYNLPLYLLFVQQNNETCRLNGSQVSNHELNSLSLEFTLGRPDWHGPDQIG